MYEVFEMLLENRGVTVAEVSRATGIAQSTFSNWKSRRNKLSANNAEKIAKYFGCSVDYLMGVQTEGQPKYYIDDETANMAQEIFSNRDLRALFSAAIDSTPEDLHMAIEILNRLKRTNFDE